MKNILITLFILSAQSLAFGKSPDILGAYTIGILTNNKSMAETRQKDFIDSTGPNGEYRVIRTVIDPNGTETYVRGWISYDAVLLDNVGKFCAKYSGSLEKIDVRGQVYDTCKISYKKEGQNIDAWYAEKVPFGVVKEIAVANPNEPLPLIQKFEIIEFGVKSLHKVLKTYSF